MRLSDKSLAVIVDKTLRDIRRIYEVNELDTYVQEAGIAKIAHHQMCYHAYVLGPDDPDPEPDHKVWDHLHPFMHYSVESVKQIVLDVAEKLE